MMCLAWAKGIECGAQKAPAPTEVPGCPNVSWFWWAAAAALALGLWSRGRRKRA